MTITAVPNATPRRFPPGDPSADHVFELLQQLNALVVDTHDFAELMDADGGITDTDYEATLTAAEILYDGYTAELTSPAPVAGLMGPFSPSYVPEELAAVMTEQLDALRVDLDAIIAKLNADAGVTADAFDEARFLSARLLTLGNLDGVNDQDSIEEVFCYEETGRGWGMTLFAFGSPDTGLQPAVYISRDSGDSWTQRGLLPASVTSVVGGVQVNRDIYVAGTTGSAIVVYKSEDFGRTWALEDHGLTLTSTDALSMMRTSDGTLLIGGAAGGEVLRGTRQGSTGPLTWSVVTISGPTGINGLGQASNGKVMACGDDAILYSSEDDGATFAVEQDFSGGNPTALAAFRELSSGRWLVTSHAGTDELQISDDEGATWETPVVLTGYASDAGAIIEGVDVVYIAANPDALFSTDEGATIGGVLSSPANVTVVTGFCHTPRGEIVMGVTNTTNFAGIYRLGTRPPQGVEAFGTAGIAGSPLGPPHGGGGMVGAWVAWATLEQRRLVEGWQALGAEMDDDDDVAGTTYEAAIGASVLSLARPAPRESGPELARA